MWVVVSLARKRLHSAHTHTPPRARAAVPADRRTPVVMTWTLWHLERDERKGIYDKSVRGKPLFAFGILKYSKLVAFSFVFLPLSALSICSCKFFVFSFSPLLATVRVKSAIAWQAEVLVEEREKERGKYEEQDGESLEWGEDLSDRLAPSPLPPRLSCIYCFPGGSSLDLPCRFWSVFTWIWPVYAVNHSWEAVVQQYANEGRAVYVRTLSAGVLSWSSTPIPLFWKEIRLRKMKGLRVFDYPPFWICCGGNPTEAVKW